MDAILLCTGLRFSWEREQLALVCATRTGMLRVSRLHTWCAGYQQSEQLPII